MPQLGRPHLRPPRGFARLQASANGRDFLQTQAISLVPELTRSNYFASLSKLMKLFAGSPVAVRPERHVPRCPRPSFHQSYHFQRQVRKAVF